MDWQATVDKFKVFFETMGNNYVDYILQLILFSVLFYAIFSILKTNNCAKFIAVFSVFVIFCGITLTFASFDNSILLIIILMITLFIFTMFHTEIKRTLLDTNIKKNKTENLTVSGIELIIDEIIKALQSMSKKDIGALIVLSNENLPEGIIESGTVVNAQITSQMIEAVFYPKAPLHDGAMIIELNKIYAAGCFLPLAQNENLPKEMGSRHRAALGVTSAASVTAIVVSEETGIISIAKNGMIVKKYADAADLKSALSDYYWSDLAAEGKI